MLIFCYNDREMNAPFNRLAIDPLLRTDPWFAHLPTPVQTAMIAAGMSKALPAGRTLFHQGGEPSGLHAILQGELHITGIAASGDEVIMAIVRPFEWVGFLTCLDGLSHAYSGTASGDTTVYSINPKAVASIFEVDVATYRLLELPELNAARKLADYVVSNIGMPLAKRVAARLTDLGRWGYGPASGPVASLENVNQEDLAMSVHASRQKVNAILRDFSASGWIEVGYCRIRVIDVEAVERFARPD